MMMMMMIYCTIYLLNVLFVTRIIINQLLLYVIIISVNNGIIYSKCYICKKDTQGIFKTATIIITNTTLLKERELTKSSDNKYFIII